MGGSGTAVSASTTNVLLESAFFAPSVIAGRARRLGLQTDASTRFERGVDPTGQRRALERATELLLAIAGGVPGPCQIEGPGDRLAPSGAASAGSAWPWFWARSFPIGKWRASWRASACG